MDITDEQIAAIEQEQPLASGGRSYVVRGRFAGTWTVNSTLTLSQVEHAIATGGTVELDLAAPVEDARAQVVETREADMEGYADVTGTASSTGIDHHGTEMSREALESMARQFRSGVAYAPVHAEREWDQIIGHTIGAEVDRVASVRNPGDPSEEQYLLRVTVRLDLSKKKARDLVRALKRSANGGIAIGQSIGGWFTKMRIIEDGEGYIIRVIVLEVELDHLAATRTPSNMDSDDLALLSRVGRCVSAFRGVEPTAQSAEPSAFDAELIGAGLQARHITDVVEGEKTWTVTFAKVDPDGDDEEEDDMTEEENRNTAPEATAPEAIAADAAAPVAALGEDGERSDDTADTAPPAEEPTTPLPDAVVAEGSTRSEANGAEDMEIDMDKNELTSLLRSAVGEALAPFEERLAAFEQGQAAPASAAEVTAAETPDQLRQRIATLEAEKAQAERMSAANHDLVTRLMNKPVRETRAYQSMMLHAAVAAEDGDFTGLIARTKEEGKCPALVAVSERSRSLTRLRAFDDNPKELGYAKPDALRVDLQKALVDLCRAADRDGRLDHLNPLKAGESGWSA